MDMGESGEGVNMMLNSINFDGIFSTGAFFHDRIFSTFHSVKISTAGISTEKFRQQKMAS